MNETVIGVGRNNLAPNVPKLLMKAGAQLGIGIREIDLESLVVDIEGQTVADQSGVIFVTHLAPTLFYWSDVALIAFEMLEKLGVKSLNPVHSTRIADDKAMTALHLKKAGVPQLETLIVDQSDKAVLEAAHQIGFPCVLKRTHGAQGRWVRQVKRPEEVKPVLEEFRHEGPSAVIVQELATDFVGKSIRVLVLNGQVLGSTVRIGAPGSFVSNISAGGSQELIDIDSNEASIAVAAATSLGLGFAGVDLCRTNGSTFVLEVNACPDFSSMTSLLGEEISHAVVKGVLN
jgi:RimK family alpha-L-glutamate ligase